NCAVCAALRDEIERENEIFSQFYELTPIEPAGEMWEAIRARINVEPQRQTSTEGRAGWLERFRAGAFGRLLAPATLRQAVFAALLIALSVAATTFYLRRNDRGGKESNISGVTVTPTPTPLAISTPTPVSSPSTEAGGPGKPNKDTPAPKSTRSVINQAAPPRQLTDQELMNRQIARAEHEYQKAIRLLDQAIAKQRDRLDPEL